MWRKWALLSRQRCQRRIKLGLWMDALWKLAALSPIIGQRQRTDRFWMLAGSHELGASGAVLDGSLQSAAHSGFHAALWTQFGSTSTKETAIWAVARGPGNVFQDARHCLAMQPNLRIALAHNQPFGPWALSPPARSPLPSEVHLSRASLTAPTCDIFQLIAGVFAAPRS